MCQRHAVRRHPAPHDRRLGHGAGAARATLTQSRELGDPPQIFSGFDTSLGTRARVAAILTGGVTVRETLRADLDEPGGSYGAFLQASLRVDLDEGTAAQSGCRPKTGL